VPLILTFAWEMNQVLQAITRFACTKGSLDGSRLKKGSHIPCSSTQFYAQCSTVCVSHTDCHWNCTSFAVKSSGAWMWSLATQGGG
jgi:hypothetical protein